MVLVGLTGGIGSGKSTIARMLGDRGAVILDADRFARDAVAAGSPGFDAVVNRFGNALVGRDGQLDRPGLAAIVFADHGARTDRVVVLESPLLIEMGMQAVCDVVVVVAAHPDTRVARLVARGMDEADARARMAAQRPLESASAGVDVLLDNDGTPAELEAQVGRLWADLRTRADGDG